MPTPQTLSRTRRGTSFVRSPPLFPLCQVPFYIYYTTEAAMIAGSAAISAGFASGSNSVSASLATCGVNTPTELSVGPSGAGPPCSLPPSAHTQQEELLRRSQRRRAKQSDEGTPGALEQAAPPQLTGVCSRTDAPCASLLFWGWPQSPLA